MLERAGDRRGVTGIPVHPEYGRWPEQVGEYRPAPVPAAGVHGHDALDRLGLPEHGIDDTGQPLGAVVGNDDGRDYVLRIRIVRRQGSACSWEAARADRIATLRSGPGLAGGYA